MSPPKPTLDDLRIERGAKPDRPVRIWPIAISIAALVVVGLVVWWLNRPKPIAVRTVLARETGSASNSLDRTVLNASGYVTARRAATVSSKVTGKVMEVLVEEGMHVNEGQVLARIDDQALRACFGRDNITVGGKGACREPCDEHDRPFSRYGVSGYRGDPHGREPVTKGACPAIWQVRFADDRDYCGDSGGRARSMPASRDQRYAWVRRPASREYQR